MLIYTDSKQNIYIQKSLSQHTIFMFHLKQCLLVGNENGWPILLALTAAPAVISSIVLPFCEDSPRYLLVILHKEDEAEQGMFKNRRHIMYYISSNLHSIR